VPGTCSIFDANIVLDDNQWCIRFEVFNSNPSEQRSLQQYPRPIWRCGLNQ
jgi:hypothetical protein